LISADSINTAFLIAYLVKRSTFAVQMQKRLHAEFSGCVQGVGFRFTAERLARRFPVTGFVRNLANGKVELVAEGEEKTLQEFLKAVREAFRDYVRDVETEWGNATAGFEGFGGKF